MTVQSRRSYGDPKGRSKLAFKNGKPSLGVSPSTTASIINLCLARKYIYLNIRAIFSLFFYEATWLVLRPEMQEVVSPLFLIKATIRPETGKTTNTPSGSTSNLESPARIVSHTPPGSQRAESASQRPAKEDDTSSGN